MAETSPTLRRRQLATRLRDLREQKGLSIKYVAEQLLCSPAKISRIETAKLSVSLRDVRDLCKLYGLADSVQLDGLMTLAREARQPGMRDDIGYRREEALLPYIDYETAASAVTEFQASFLPGLLQTEDYARALIRGMLPRISDDSLQNRTKLRMERHQRLLREELPRYWAIFDETALHRRVGGREIMRSQLEYLVELSELPHVDIQVIPFEVGAYMGLDNSFQVLEIPDPTLPRLVYTEGIATAEYFEKASDLGVYQETLERLRAAALDPRGSVRLITRTLEQEYSR